MDDAVIRRLEPRDAPAFHALRLRALREHPEAFTSSWEDERDRPIEAAARRLDAADADAPVKFWGAFEAAQLVGMVGLDRETRRKNRHKATLVAMYVAPEAGRRGIGRRLVEALLAEARASGVASLLLTVTHGNAAARDLYARMGFFTFGIETDAVRVDGRAFAKEHMRLALGPPAAAH